MHDGKYNFRRAHKIAYAYQIAIDFLASARTAYAMAV